MTNRIQTQSSAHQHRTAKADLGEADLGQTDAKLEHRSEEKLRKMGGRSKGAAQKRHPPRLGQKRAKQEAAGETVLKGLSPGDESQ